MKSLPIFAGVRALTPFIARWLESSASAPWLRSRGSPSGRGDFANNRATSKSNASEQTAKRSIFPIGHFYSPIVDTVQVSQFADRVWEHRVGCAGIDFNAASHLQVLEQWFPQFVGDYDYPDHGEPSNPNGFFSLNDQFSWLDARTLFVLLRQLRPRRVIEVGSGFSSLLIADVNQRFLHNRCEFTCIEPYPREFLRRGVPGVSRLIEQRAETLDVEAFAALDDGDILFIDSSHVAKTGSDVNFLLFDVLPMLKPGVIVHIHDIFLPAEYPKAWVIDENRSWNEQYAVRALLMYSTRFRILFGCAYAALVLGEAVVKALARPDGHGMGGGSLWLRVSA